MDAVSRVVITGLGAICASGMKPSHIFNSILNSATNFADLEIPDLTHWPCRLAGVVRSDLRELIRDRKLLKLIKRTDVFGIFAAEQALISSGISEFREALTTIDDLRFSERFGIYVGTSGASYDMQHDFLSLVEYANGNMSYFGKMLQESVNPMWLLRNLPNNVLCHVGIRNRLRGPNTCATNQGTSGMLSIIEAYEGLLNNEADRALAIGHDAPLDPQNMLYYHHLGLISEGFLAPFDSDRSGTLLGEGGAALLLETLEAAISRSAVIHAEILGKGSTCEAHGLLPVRSDGNGIARAISLALEQAALECQQIGLIVCHGNGTMTSDHSEGAAIRSIFGNCCPPITSFKWSFGHTLAASACIDIILAVLAVQHQIVPAIPNIKRIDSYFEDLPITTTSTQPTSDIALILSRGFGGQNSALIVKRYG